MVTLSARSSTLTYFVPVITATVVLSVLAWSGLRIQADLEQEAIERAFQNIGDNVDQLAERFASQLDVTERSSARYAELLSSIDAALTPAAIDFNARQFDRHYQRDGTGVWRTPKAGYDPAKDCGLLVPPTVPLTDETKAWFEMACQVTETYGRASKDMPFLSSYVMPFINGIALYWPSEPDYIYVADASYNYLETDWLTLSNEQRNPEGRVMWTPASYDPVTQKTLVSAMTPVYFRGKRFASAGHDLELEQLAALFAPLRAYEGYHAALLRDDGMVMVSPNYRDNIVSSNGTFHVSQIDDGSLQAAWQALQSTPTLRQHSDAEKEVFIRNIGTRHWKLMISVPKAPVLAPIQASFTKLKNIAILALLAEMALATVMLWWLERGRRQHEKDLRNSMLALKNLNDELDSKVQERTVALQNSVNELEAFNSVVSHDLRAPLRHLQAYLIELQESVTNKLNQDEVGYLDKCRQATTRLYSMVNEMLAMARIGRDAIKRQPVDLNRMVDEIKLELASSYDNASKITRDELPVVSADPALLRQALQNLLDNACKYTAKVAEPNIHVSHIALPEPMWRIEISDNGVGFDNAYADRLFRLFSRLHRSEEFSGIGIGLAISAKIIRSHNGTISADSQQNVRTTFRVDLPKTAD